jgi:hypothetical protein
VTPEPIICVDLNTTHKERWDNVLVFRAGHLCGLKFLFALEQSDAEQAMLFDQRVSFPKQDIPKDVCLFHDETEFRKALRDPHITRSVR